MTFNDCSVPDPGGESHVNATWIFFQTGSPSGYMFDGTVDVWAADASGCPTGPSLSSTPLLPIGGEWNQIALAGGNVAVPSQFVVTYTLSTTGTAPDPVGIASDHPAAGPTGPQACGSCFPNSRAIHSFYFGTNATALCPGSTINDTVCDAEFLWDVQTMVAVEETSWSQIKSLYR